MFSDVGIIGFGYVGEAVAQSILPPFQPVIIDPVKNFNATYEDIKKCGCIFVCVPSPRANNGDCDTSIIDNILSNLTDYKGVIISKVTAPPKYYEEKALEFPNLVHVPEFLTADNHVWDFSNTEWVVIGGSVGAYQREAARFIKEIQPCIKQIEFCSIGEAAMLKYIVNSFLATKVVFMNEMAQLSDAHGYDWRQIQNLVKMDRRIGESHMKVPGPDGLNGFGGACFPKDTDALINYAHTFNMSLNVLENALKKNMLLRLTKPK